ncbi:hypothetical protein DIS24_g7269 [Lasiodiplodia hormozganensis]|uniref:(S)-ureidoglycine aminohydrolase cupin domain-containing protein n=1 Tax=Lasiodiplodia hormozganensis TaxID=869390 RepID=A0AA39Y8K6_9PEZI|nr:hypothetical protein DIS24_g7269 [Lasiodiplodia hormozganensis]
MSQTMTVVPPPHVVHGGVQNPPSEQWTPFEWEEPTLGKQVHGEVTVIRTEGSSGSLTAGFWRTGPTSPGASKDGSHQVVYSSPLGDETACIIDGTVTLTVSSTGERFEAGPGSIISSPKGLEVHWDIKAPAFKKYWCIWSGTSPTDDQPKQLTVHHVTDNPEKWEDYHFTEPKEGPQVAGELFFIRTGGSSGTMLSGIWRSGKGIAGTNVDEKGTLVTPYTGILGDETILLLEGRVTVVETETGKTHHFKAGDVIGLTSGVHVTWTSHGPFTKKLWVITRDAI